VSETNRRNFIKGLSLGGVALAATAAAPAAETPSSPSVASPAEPRSGSDLMVDVLRGLGILHVSQIPGSTFAGLQESLINYGMVTEPAMSMLTVTHEEIAVAFAHGYAKVSGKPMACMVHSAVGLQHACMAIYNAYCDRAPILTITGSLTDPASRESFVDWMHAVSDGPALTRDFTKFDETPRSLPHFIEATTRAYLAAMTPPAGPVVIAADLDLQEHPAPADLRIALSKPPRIAPPQGEASAVREAARMLVAAELPVIVADRAARTPEGLRLLVELAELLNAGVVDMQSRMNFPWRHPLNQTSIRAATLHEADVVLALELQDVAGTLRPASHARKISINALDYNLKSNYQTFAPLAAVDLAIAGDSEATLPALIEEVQRVLGKRGRGVIEARGRKLADASAGALEASREAAAVGWDIAPITTARLYAEIYAQIRDRDWALLNATHFQNYWPQQLWDARAHHQYIGDSGASGLGYLPGAAVGAAFAHKDQGRVPIVVGGDGDFMMAPGALWTAAYHKIPLLYFVHNNGGYHQERMKIQQQCNHRGRGLTRGTMGCDLPSIDYSKIAQGFGIDAQRVTDPAALRAAITRGLDVVSRGEPALIDVISQGR
jgi:thiamine pyrophosphate-dependent acetolactate synthase large subunit-like protein